MNDHKYKTATVFILAAFLIVLVCIVTARMAEASDCPYFTGEQRNMLRIAHALGDRHGLGDTAAAIVWRESLGCRPGVHVCTSNLADGVAGSYGPMQMQISTYASHYHNVYAGEFEWSEWASTAQRMMDDPVFAIEAGLGYLVHHVHQRGWRAGIARYHGGGQQAADYSADIVRRVRVFESGCRP